MNYTYEAILFFSNVWNLQLWESELTVITELNTLLFFFLIHHEYLRGHLICFSERSGAYRMQLQFPQITTAVHFSCFACYIPSWFKGMKHIRSLKSNSSKLWVLNLNSLWESKIWNVIKKNPYVLHILSMF